MEYVTAVLSSHFRVQSIIINRRRQRDQIGRADGAATTQGT